jgi:hypothetical protein
MTRKQEKKKREKKRKEKEVLPSSSISGFALASKMCQKFALSVVHLAFMSSV